jgi:hypothetical protein
MSKLWRGRPAKQTGRPPPHIPLTESEAVPIGDGMQIGEKNFLSGKEETRRIPDGFQAFLTQPDETFSVMIRAGAYWYSF